MLPGDIWQCQITLLVTTGVELADISQVEAKGCYNAQDSPTTNNYLIQNVNSVKVESPGIEKWLKNRLRSQTAQFEQHLLVMVTLGKLPNL